MTLVQDIAKELFSMFLCDARLTGAIVALVLLAEGLILRLDVDPLIGGATLLFGCLIILVDAAARETRHRQ